MLITATLAPPGLLKKLYFEKDYDLIIPLQDVINKTTCYVTQIIL